MVRNPTFRWLPSQNGLFADAPHLHNATRVSSLTVVWSWAIILIFPCTYNGPLGRSTTVVSSGTGSCGPPSRRRKCSAPVGQRWITSPMSAADPSSTAIQGRRPLSNTAGRPRRHSAAWMQNAGSQLTSIRSFAYTLSTVARSAAGRGSRPVPRSCPGEQAPRSAQSSSIQHWRCVPRRSSSITLPQLPWAGQVRSAKTRHWRQTTQGLGWHIPCHEHGRSLATPGYAVLRRAAQRVYRLDHLPSRQEVLVMAEKWRALSRSCDQLSVLCPLRAALDTAETTE